MSVTPTIADCSTLTRLDWKNHWLTINEYARVANRHVRTVRYWCETGTLRAFNIPHFRDRRGKWWIQNIP